MAILRINGGRVPEIREIARGSFPRLWEPKEFAYFTDNPCGLCLGDFDDESGRLRAYFLGLLIQGDLDVVSLATHSDFRRRGIGESLLRHVLSLTNVERAFLEVEARNSAALALYGKLGFKRTGMRKAYYDGLRDAVVMEWKR